MGESSSGGGKSQREEREERAEFSCSLSLPLYVSCRMVVAFDLNRRHSIMRQELLSLDTQKKALLSEAEAIVSELTTNQPGGGPPIGIDALLVDDEGYPRADIDVYRARTLRKRFKEIQTDVKVLEKKIEFGLVEIAAQSTKNDKSNVISPNSIAKDDVIDDEEEKKLRLAPKPKPKFDVTTGKWVVKSWDGSVAGVLDGEKRSFDNLDAPPTVAEAINERPFTSPSGRDNTSNNDDNTAHQQRLERQRMASVQGNATPFAIIDEVSSNSPAFEAGIKENDILLRFGSVDCTNHRDFKAIAELLPMAASNNDSITVVVRRKSMELGGFAELTKTEVMELRPRPWGGRGLLGCHIRPYSD